MSELTVLLRLSGTGTADRLASWVAALGQVAARRRVLQLDGRLHDDAAVLGACGDARVELVPALGQAVLEAPDVLVLGSADDLPTPGALRRLVTSASISRCAVLTRVLPHGSAVTQPGAVPTPAPVVCVALPGLAVTPAIQLMSDATDAVAAARSAGIDILTLESAAVFTDRRSAGSAPPVSFDPPDTSPPYGHPAALPATSLHQLLVSTSLTPPALPVDAVARPLLTVLTRTQGTRLLCLEETLTCLAGQSSRDFEVVVACHRVTPEALSAVRALVELLPPWLRERTRVLEVARPGRSAPLNDALDVARGRYAVMLDDDDAVAGDWVAAFAEAESRGPGTVLRSVALAQDVRPVVNDASVGPAPFEVGPARPVWPAGFSLVEHLMDNASPPMTFAVPRGVFADLGHRFEESLDTTEDWDFLLRAAVLTGVTSTPAITATYRVWTGDEGSRHLHDEDEWAAGRAAVLATVDAMVTLLPPGSAADLRELHEALAVERAEKFRFAALNEQAAADLGAVNEAVVALRARIAQLEDRLDRQRRRRQSD